MTARTKKEWRCDNCGSTTATPTDQWYCTTCTGLGECDICDEYTFGNDHSWHCDDEVCGQSATADDPRSTSVPTMHVRCVGKSEQRAEQDREYQQHLKDCAAQIRKDFAAYPCAMAGDGGCGVPGPDDWEADIAWCPQDGAKYLCRDGVRYLCRTHDLSANKEQRAAEAEAKRVYDALPKELYCSTCDKVVAADEVDDESWYECENCGGEEFNRDMSANDNHQCPYCSKFAKRSDTDHCGECREPLEVRPVGVTA